MTVYRYESGGGRLIAVSRCMGILFKCYKQKGTAPFIYYNGGYNYRVPKRRFKGVLTAFLF